LSGLAGGAGIVVAPVREAGVKHVEFVALGGGQALAVMVFEDGVVENRLMQLAAGVTPSALQEASDFLNARMRGKTLAEAGQDIRLELELARRQLDVAAARLVEEGLARAFGVTRQLPDGTSGNEYREALADRELTAAAAKKGIWAVTDWKHLAEDRAEERRESAELQTVLKDSHSTAAINLNTATAEELQSLPGIGKKLAERIIEARTKNPIRSPQDLLAIKGITPKLFESLTPKLQFTTP
jgi:competence ComEA-like helix-hairpin-helix protein